jgi:uncharacterized protein (DUF2236 family)
MGVVTPEEHEVALAELAREITNPREGILGASSQAFQLGGDLALFIGGGRAALLQLAHPMVAFALDRHSHTREDVVGRFQRTFRNVFAMVFGDLDAALKAARRVHSVHTRIHGAIPHDVGRWRAGTPYHANDADALRWVHATLLDTTVAVRERLDGALPTGQKDAYIVEMNRFARLFGIPRDRLPDSWAAHASYMRRMLSGDELAVAPCAREMGMFLVGRGGAHQPRLGRLTEIVTASLLPDHFVTAFGLRASPLAARLAIDSWAPLYRRIPRALVAIPSRAEAMRRIAGKPPSKLARWTENRLMQLTRQVTGT